MGGRRGRHWTGGGARGCIGRILGRDEATLLEDMHLTLRTLMQAGPAKANELLTRLAETSDGALKTRERLFAELKAELETHVGLMQWRRTLPSGATRWKAMIPGQTPRANGHYRGGTCRR